MADTAIFDVDGTLVDTNYHHAIAWHRSFLHHDVVVPVWHIHRAIGMGGDVLVAHVAGDDVEEQHGDDIRDRWEKEFDAIIDEVRPFEDAHELLVDVRERGFKVVLASSGMKKHVEKFLDLVDAAQVADDWTTSDDAERSKPAPDLVAIAMERVGGASAVLVGDSTWDCGAAAKLDVPTIAVQTGGYSPEELEDAGAVQVFESLTALRTGLDSTALALPDSSGN
jgi:HAD superfamily hydrolase (TIGR01549 family)